MSNVELAVQFFLQIAVIPREVMTRDAIAKIQPLRVTLLLPLFFTFSGLNTRPGLLNSPSD